MLAIRTTYSPIGFDFRDASLVVTQHRMGRGRRRIHAHAARRIDPLAGPEAKLEAFSEVIASLLANYPFEGEAAVATMPSTMVETRPVRLPVGVKTDQDEGFFPALLQEARNFLLFDPREAVLDYLPTGMERFEDEERMGVILFAAPLARVDGYLAMLRRHKLVCERLEFSPCAFMRALPPSPHASALVELNMEHTSISIIQDGQLLFNRVVGVGLGGVLAAIRKDFGVGNIEAWSMLQHYGIQHEAAASLNMNWVLQCGLIEAEQIAGKFFQSGKATYDRVGHEIKRSLSYYTNHRHGRVIDHILLAGEMVVPGIEAFLRNRLNFTVLQASHALRSEETAVAEGEIASGLVLQGSAA